MGGQKERKKERKREKKKEKEKRHKTRQSESIKVDAVEKQSSYHITLLSHSAGFDWRG